MFEVIQEQQQSINRRLFQVISGLSGTKVSAEELTDAIYAFYKMAEEMPILKLIGTGIPVLGLKVCATMPSLRHDVIYVE